MLYDSLNIENWAFSAGSLGRERKMKKGDIVAAHRYSSNHRESVLASEVCGCFYCLSIFSPSEIKDWIDAREDETDINKTGQTALCPHCGIDSVIGSASGYPIDREFLKKMNDYWFQRTVTIEQAAAQRRGKPRA